MKSVAALWAVAPPEIALLIQQAHDAAVADALAYLDIRKELVLPDPIRRAWQPLIRNALPTRRHRRATDAEREGPPGALIRLRTSRRSRQLRLGNEESEDHPSS